MVTVPQDQKIHSDSLKTNNEQSTIVKPTTSRKKLILLGVLGIIFLLCLLAGAYVLGTKNTTKNLIVYKPTPSSTSSEVVVPSKITSVIHLPNNWSVKKSEACGVSFAVPPKEAPYYIATDSSSLSQGNLDIGRYWNFYDQKLEGSSLTFFTHMTSVAHTNPDELGNDYVSGSVYISCGPNNKHYTTASFVKEYAKQFMDGTYSGLEFKEIKTVTLWGHAVSEVLITGGQFGYHPQYFFATPSKLYSVSEMSGSDNTDIKNTTNTIFTTLQFEK